MDFKLSFLVHLNVLLLRGQIRYIFFGGLIEEDYWKMISSSLVNKTLKVHGKKYHHFNSQCWGP
jgi:hypothetical protein